MTARKISKADQKTLTEARAAISRLAATMNQGSNRGGSYGDSCRDAIARWEATIRKIEASDSPKG